MFQNYMIMKKILMLCVIVMAALSSCAPTISPFRQSAGYIDYSMFPGMFLTESNSVSFDYQPIASLFASEVTGEYKVEKKRVRTDEIYGNEYVEYDGKVRFANPQSALIFAVEKAKSMGGNGIINLKIGPYTNRGQDGYFVSGMVIKRK